MLALLLASPAGARDERPPAPAVASEVAPALLAELTTRFGARPAGSPADRAAAAWLAGRLRAFGLSHVAIESFPILRWSPGDAAVDVIAPERRRLVATPLGGLVSGPTVTARVVAYDTYAAFLAAPADSVRGRIVAVLEALPGTADGAGYLRLVVMRSEGPAAAARKGAAGFVLRSLATHHERLASSGATKPLARPFPAFAISPPDAEELGRLATKGPVTLRLRPGAGWSGRAVTQNVVATLPGRDPTAPAVLVSAHLDSWEQGTGASDDGFGIAAVVAAVKALHDRPHRPLRSIRLVLFGAEEVTQPGSYPNFAGARRYIELHRRELAGIDLAAESDWGGGRIVGLRLPDLGDPGLDRRLAAGLASENVLVRTDRSASGPPDADVLKAAGVPLLRLDQDATLLFDTHHNARDTLDQVDMSALRQNVRVWTTVLRLLADRPLTPSPSPRPLRRAGP
ncbi:M20/M25/M40 family metallo-hydrolase [Sphingomonas sp. BK580]|uniref:M20/M25/M40 family metallo-hydrolase n=1 Tax=Sphingomonas sp. BK580 TaxID=2586972 RepID=UPI00160F418E|nr:M20/M25/M40 family metallo-hydrolase [Sphingomonas sp. BK580]MBB3695155.1 hypothetical protein [Sphingomonas sp. BK580]